MSLITNIIGWIETDGFDKEKEYNDKILKELKYSEDDFFIEMFCSPKDTGTKNPDYILFGASLNHFAFDCWLEKFEEFIKNLKAFGAFVFVAEHDGEYVYAIGYDLYNGRFTKDVVKLGKDGDYNWFWDGKDYKDIHRFPLLFRILKIFKSEVSLLYEQHIAYMHIQTEHPDVKYSENLVTKHEDKKYGLAYLVCSVCTKKLARKWEHSMTWQSAEE